MRKNKKERNNKAQYKRIIPSLALALCLAVSIPASALAAEGSDVSVTEEMDSSASEEVSTPSSEVMDLSAATDMDASEDVVLTVSGDPADDQETDSDQGGDDQEPELTGVVEEDGMFFYYLDGEKQTTEGKIEWDGKLYYALDGGALATDQIILIDGVSYYAGKDAVIVQKEGWIKTAGEWYFLNEDGSLRTNGWADDSKGRCYLNDAGIMVKNKWIKDGEDWYYIKANGYMAASEWAKDSKGWCWLNGSGKQVKDKWVKDGEDWYYIKADGYMAANEWAKDSKGWCWLNGSGKQVKDKWVKDGEDWYYIKANGYMAASEWAEDSKGKCYLNASGKMVKNQWITSNGNRYFLKADGHLATNQTVKDGDVWYYVDSSGRISKTMDGMDRKAQSYSSNTRFLILVDRDEHMVGIYEGSQGNWNEIRSFPCGNGKASTPTITGSFNIPSKYPRSQPYFDSGSARCWYPTRIHGGYLFHSVLYYQSSSPSSIMDGRLGVGVSHGCVRLRLDNAKYIYDNIPIGTKVVIY